jgi:threonine dehydrogenase-like Zn-dependent dehydrogenase
MKALCWHGKGDIRCDDVPDPQIEHGRDAIIRTTACAICGSDLHVMDGYIPFMEKGDVLGHEFMGEVVEVGADNKKLKVGDRVVVPFTICCGNASSVTRAIGRSANARTVPPTTRRFRLPDRGLFGYRIRRSLTPVARRSISGVPFADISPIIIPAGITDEQALFLGDISDRMDGCR